MVTSLSFYTSQPSNLSVLYFFTNNSSTHMWGDSPLLSELRLFSHSCSQWISSTSIGFIFVLKEEYLSMNYRRRCSIMCGRWVWKWISWDACIECGGEYHIWLKQSFLQFGRFLISHAIGSALASMLILKNCCAVVFCKICCLSHLQP